VRDADQCMSMDPGVNAAGKYKYQWKVSEGVRTRDLIW
jgi:hypothetical protein